MPPNTQSGQHSAAYSPNQYVDLEGRRLAYRSIGEGTPLVLCTRFRGTMDTWDPAFLDGLVAEGLRVITFDYAGLGLSAGERTYNPAVLAKDTAALIGALGLGRVVLGGWSLGGIVAQVLLATRPDLVSHAVLIGTTPPGPVVKLPEQLFIDTARIPGSSLDKDTILFFEPASAESRAAAERSAKRLSARQEGRSPEVPGEWAAAQLGDRPRNPPFPADAVLAALKATKVPVLHIGADHDIAFPVENWYALNSQLPTLQLLTYPQAGHAPHHQYPEASAAYIGTFVHSTLCA
ncbi:alpha/beta fold hydrolase [Pararoseomonas indoligenes]|uniref:Alpha/beta hydrolase n=1 Tax=Roseomonas indoligenes TaxID=2820811 RepID=A0A940S7P2_9PROT|nr:alpha/beta hydrolase [Pararoseomonas indoligenes]MBP0495130.1 alpha/beta hydrolase [Pararoseomonas indoligenes]